MEDITLNFVDEFNSGKDFWNMKGRVIRVWKQSFRWDFIIIDERGRKIQGHVKNHLVHDFADVLKEDAVVLIRNFGVADQRDKHRVLPLNHKINFFKCTTVTKVCGFRGHPYGFNFVPFTAINENSVGPVLTVDVMGRVAWSGDLEIFTFGGNESKRINFDLQDLGSNVLRCTLWGVYAEQFSDFVAANTSTEMVIVIIQHGRIKQWGGVKTVQNDMFGTRLFINEEVQEANDFRRSMILRDGGNSSQTVLSSQTVYPTRNEFLSVTPRKHVDELIDITKESTCIVLATITMVEEDFGWFYKACRTCTKKALTKSEYLEQAKDIPDDFIDAPIDSLWCGKCKGIASALVPKFKVQCRVQDSTGSVSFVMFDKDVQKILGISAVDVRENQLRRADMEAFPRELQGLMNKFLAFKVSVSDYNLKKNYHVYTVAKICDDSSIISELQVADQVEEAATPVAHESNSAKLDEFSQTGMESKDCGSVTGESLAADVEKDSGTSPGGKRSIPFSLDEATEDEAFVGRPAKKAFQG